jgi:[ribosomal protein S18]-alanine N-acetyltransferase
MISQGTYQASEFELSPMTEHDLLEVVEIEESCGLSRWGWEGYYTELLCENAALMVVARRRSAKGAPESMQLAGFIAARLAADELHINNVAVRVDYRRQSIGSALLSAVLERGREMGARKAFLEVRVSNAAAQALYARHGFETVGRRERYYSMPLEDALVMAVML